MLFVFFARAYYFENMHAVQQLTCTMVHPCGCLLVTSGFCSTFTGASRSATHEPTISTHNLVNKRNAHASGALEKSLVWLSNS